MEAMVLVVCVCGAVEGVVSVWCGKGGVGVVAVVWVVWIVV